MISVYVSFKELYNIIISHHFYKMQQVTIDYMLYILECGTQEKCQINV